MSDAPRGSLFIVSSPSGGGKTTLIRRLLANPPGERRCTSPSPTRRGPGATGEEDGREYHFVTAAEFEKMARHGEFLEHNEVHGNFYGTAKSEVLPRLAAGEDVVLDIDVQGARDIRRGATPRPISIFIVPSSARSSSGGCGSGGSTGRMRSGNASSTPPRRSRKPRIFNTLS